MTDLLLGIDVGTTWCKAAVVSLDGRELAHDRAPVAWRTLERGAEIDPAGLFELAVTASSGALLRAPSGRVLAVGVTSMAETGALLDADEAVVAPAIAWHDHRGGDEAERLRTEIGEERFSSVTGLPASYFCTLAKHRWLRAHEPAAGRGVRWLNVAEYVVRRFGGEQLADLSLASRTGMLDLDGQGPWAEALDWAGAPPALLPPAAPSGTPAGHVGEGLEQARRAVLCVAGHDHLCAAIGAGAVRDDDVFDSCGTAEAFVRALPPPTTPDLRTRAVAAGATVGWHAIPGRQVVLGAFESGLELQRLGKRLGAVEESDRTRLEAEPGEQGRTWRAAHESLAAQAAETLALVEDLAGPTGRLVVSGGGARSGLARELKRSALGPYDLPAVQEAGARGAALLAGCAAGVYAGVHDLPPAEMTAMEALS